jgi:diguanylate cyclase (GGDEF)-like protein
MTIEHATHVCKVEVQAITDGMTGLFNYRHFQTLLEREYKRASRYNRTISLIMIDIDHFKKYNDTNGHLQGDETLRKVAALIKNSCRDVDFAVRYGGEEFAVLLPETSVDEALSIAERLRQSIEEYPFVNREKQPNQCLTISLGLANYPTDAVSILELLDHADAALYQAKRSTRNCVCLYRRYTNPL